MPELNPVLTKILWNRLISIVDEAATGLVRTSYSIVVRDYHDYCVGIFDAQGNMLVHSTKTAPGFIGMMPIVMKRFLEVYPADTLVEGDAMVTNDPWLATGHLLDLTIAIPIFFENRLLGFAVCVVHHLDIGGRMACIESKDMFEEGLKIPIMKLCEGGRRNETVFEFIRANVRMAPKVLGDVNAQFSALNICAAGVLKMIREYGYSDLDALAETIIALAGRSMRNSIRSLPNGTYHNAVDLPAVGRLQQPMHINVVVEVRDEEITVDYSGSSPQIEAAVNVTLPFTTSYTTYGLKVILDPDVPNNAGCLAPITVKAPEGSLLNCKPPAPTWGRTIIAHNLPEIVFGALAEALPERVIAACGSTPLVAMYFNGHKNNGQEFLSIVSHSGGFGASGQSDGYGALCFPFNTAAIPVEVTENDTCLVYQKKEFAVDTGGPGQFRGGLGQEVIFSVATGDHAPLAPVASTIRGSSRKPDSSYPVFGRKGGKPGRGALITVKEEPILPGMGYRLDAGDIVRLVLPGGGGFGCPLDRDPELVRADVIAGYVSKNSALEEYGVALKGPDMVVDVAMTRQARHELAASLQITT